MSSLAGCEAPAPLLTRLERNSDSDREKYWLASSWRLMQYSITRAGRFLFTISLNQTGGCSTRFNRRLHFQNALHRAFLSVLPSRVYNWTVLAYCMINSDSLDRLLGCYFCRCFVSRAPSDGSSSRTRIGSKRVLIITIAEQSIPR